MAGIGFELRKVASLGTARGIFQASLSGIMIVAGPWLITIGTILLFRHPALGIPDSFRELFTASTVYIYAGSLIMTGGFHYIFTRILSDYLYRNEYGRAFAYTLRYILRSSTLLIPTALLMARTLMPGDSIPIMHKLGFVLLFFFINHIWILMLTASAIRHFNQLLICFLVGMGSSLICMRLAMLYLGPDSLLLAYTTGQALIFVLLLAILYKGMGWERLVRKGEFIHYIRSYPCLFITGFLYYGALWGDKIAYWFLRGERASGTAMRLYTEYDLVVYFTNLMMIPALVFFVIYSETEFFISLKKMLDSLTGKTVKTIQTRKYALISATKRILREQAALQAVVALVFIGVTANSPHLSGDLILYIPSVLSISLLSLFICLINFMFYVEQYLTAMLCTLLFLAVNVLLPVHPLLGEVLMPGVSSLIGIGLATLSAGLCFRFILKNLPRIIFSSMNRSQLRKIREEQLKNS